MENRTIFFYHTIADVLMSKGMINVFLITIKKKGFLEHIFAKSESSSDPILQDQVIMRMLLIRRSCIRTFVIILILILTPFETIVTNNTGA